MCVGYQGSISSETKRRTSLAAQRVSTATRIPATNHFPAFVNTVSHVYHQVMESSVKDVRDIPQIICTTASDILSHALVDPPADISIPDHSFRVKLHRRMFHQDLYTLSQAHAGRCTACKPMQKSSQYPDQPSATLRLDQATHSLEHVQLLH